MGEKVSDSTTIAAPIDTVWEVITDLDAYPQWAEGVLEAGVESRNADGYPDRGRFRVDARIAEVRYVLAYSYQDYDISWKLIEGETISQLDGAYELWEEDGGTGVNYELEVDVDMPVPGFLKKRAAKHILEQGLRGLKRRAEERA
jgi:uncharacterized protein YndB with AHSA1/START domain